MATRRTFEHDGEVRLPQAPNRKPDWLAGRDAHVKAKIDWYMKLWRERKRYFSCYSEIHLLAFEEANADMWRAVKKWDRSHGSRHAAIEL